MYMWLNLREFLIIQSFAADKLDNFDFVSDSQNWH